MADTKQSNFETAQDFNLDIEKVYKDYISAIDKVRSCNVTTKIQKNDLDRIVNNSFTISDASSSLKKMCDLNTSPQESRCHAFFRIIGFPVADSDYEKIYNPGLDNIVDPDRKIDGIFKLNILKNQESAFRKLSIERETYVSKTLNIFSAQTSIDAATLALSSGRNIRKFIAPLNEVAFNDTDITNSQYKMDFNSFVEDIPTKLTEYQDIAGNKSAKLSSFKFEHIIKPFLVDPIIDLTVNDSSKLIAVPFVQSKSNLQIKNNEFVSRPIIEQIIRDRFAIVSSTDSGTANETLNNYITNVSNITDPNIINNFNKLIKQDNTSQYIKFINIIFNMIDKLIAAQDIIKTAQQNYYYIPIPSTSGPELGSSVQGILFSDKINTQFIPSKDFSIIMSSIKRQINQFDSSTASVNATPDVGGFALPNALGLPSLGTSNTPDSLGSNNTENLQSLLSKRESILKQANAALRTVEIIMGEFSGLGLCDIIAIIGGLYLMPRDSLFGFLDDDAIIRAGASGIPAHYVSLSEASDDLISSVKDFYNLMDKIYEDKMSSIFK
ncbi:hypothetical protein UFOVP1290_23 [uncultured Caudovirales phage]|uniref:Uncharacterized protein n=1 Tax=uncultured Caudovirales phage TaxID=2100421 RepID=A0A6J5RGP5_9CAUD|nr:hypothetical protein UFOVP1290_23 [uncultured Caudovirales phage]